MNEKNKGIDFLRLVLMFMICVLHVLGHGGVLKASKIGSVQSNLFWFLEIFSICAVDAFALIFIPISVTIDVIITCAAAMIYSISSLPFPFIIDNSIVATSNK